MRAMLPKGMILCSHLLDHSQRQRWDGKHCFWWFQTPFCTPDLELELKLGAFVSWKFAFSECLQYRRPPQPACCFPGLFSPGLTQLFYPAPRALPKLYSHLLLGVSIVAQSRQNQYSSVYCHSPMFIYWPSCLTFPPEFLVSMYQAYISLRIMYHLVLCPSNLLFIGQISAE